MKGDPKLRNWPRRKSRDARLGSFRRLPPNFVCVDDAANNDCHQQGLATALVTAHGSAGNDVAQCCCHDTHEPPARTFANRPINISP